MKNPMKAARWGKALIVAALMVPILSPADPADSEATEFEHVYGQLLARYWHAPVMINGIETTVFDYAGMKRDTRRPNSLFNRTLQAIERVQPDQLGNADQAKAFWINAYNFAAMRLIVDHYPVDSIRSLSISLLMHPWSKQAIRIGNRHYSLVQIEKDILLAQFKDPRIVFGVSCAAVSCPDRTMEPFVAERLDQQLDTMIRSFLQNPGKGLRLDRESRILTLSWIFKKDGELFPINRLGVPGFLLPYLTPELQEWLEGQPVRIAYFDHDWTLNDLVQAD